MSGDFGRNEQKFATVAKMKPRRAYIKVFYNEIEISPDVSSFGYTSSAEGVADSLNLTIEDRDKLWVDEWFPTKGDKLTASIFVENWTEEGDNRSLDCGSFTLDSIGISGEAISVSVGAVAKPANSEFSATKRTQTWEQVTLKEVAEGIAKRYGLTVFYDAGDIRIDAQEQSETEDGAFLKKLCDDYGIVLKVYQDKLILYDRKMYKEKDAVYALCKEDLGNSWTLRSDLEGSYTSGIVEYTSSKSEKTIKYEFGQGGRVLKINEKVDNQADAEKKLISALEKANHNLFCLSVNMMGEIDLIDGMTVDVIGFGTKISGKYFVTQVEHKISRSGGFTTSVELSKVEDGVTWITT